MGKNQNDCSIRVPCLRLLDESDWDNAEPESPDMDLWISLGCSRGHAKASRQRDDYGEETIMSIELPCSQHIGEFEVDEATGCPNCGTLLNLDYCWFCGANWLHFGSGFDDVIADAVATESGDLECARCYSPEEEEWDGTEVWEEA